MNTEKGLSRLDVLDGQFLVFLKNKSISALGKLIRAMWRIDAEGRFFLVWEAALIGATVVGVCLILFTGELSPWTRVGFTGLVLFAGAVYVWESFFFYRREIRDRAARERRDRQYEEDLQRPRRRRGG